jgi:hypothetical protein
MPRHCIGAHVLAVMEPSHQLIGKEYTDFEPEALWDDGTFAIKHWHDLSHLAVASKHVWLNAMVSMFKPFLHGDVRRLELAELPAAKEWVTVALERATS